MAIAQLIHAVQTVFSYLIFYASKNIYCVTIFFALFSHYQIGYLLKRQMVVRGCLFCHRFAENLVTTHFPICPFYVAYISYVVCKALEIQCLSCMQDFKCSIEFFICHLHILYKKANTQIKPFSYNMNFIAVFQWINSFLGK